MLDMSSPFERRHSPHPPALLCVGGEKIEEACNIRPGMCTNNYRVTSFQVFILKTALQMKECIFDVNLGYV